jgi:sugar diacid utilization regulator
MHGQIQYPLYEAFESGEVQIVKDIYLDPRKKLLSEFFELSGSRSAICVPVVRQAQVIGVLACYGTAPREPSTVELGVLGTIAHFVADAIQISQLVQDLQDSNARLQAMSSELIKQNEGLEKLNELQSGLLSAVSDGFAVQQLVEHLTQYLGGVVAVVGPNGELLGRAGSEESQAGLELDGISEPRASVSRGLASWPIGSQKMPLARLKVDPPVSTERRIEISAVNYAVALASYAMQLDRTDRNLEQHTKPALLLALAHGGLRSARQIKETAGLLSVLPDAGCRLVLVPFEDQDHAERASRSLSGHRAASLGIPYVTSAVMENRLLVLLRYVSDDVKQRTIGKLFDLVDNEMLGVAVSGPLANLGDLPRGLAQAEAVCRILQIQRITSRPTFFEDIGPFGRLLEHIPELEVQAMVDAVLQPLRKYDEEHRTMLLETLETYVRRNGRPKIAAQELHIHENTLYQRLRRCEDLSGLNLNSFTDISYLAMVFQWRALNYSAPDE